MIPVSCWLPGEDDITAAVRVLGSGQVLHARQVPALEDDFAVL